MTFYDDKLRELQNQIARKGQLEAMIAELETQRRDLVERVKQLETIMLDEQDDVERLEGRSLAAFFYHVIGKMDGMLRTVQQEGAQLEKRLDQLVQETRI